MKIFDAHTHIDYITPNFQPDVIGAIVCATKQSDWNQIVDLIKHDNRVYGAFGIHPWFVENVCDDFDVCLEILLKTNSLAVDNQSFTSSALAIRSLYSLSSSLSFDAAVNPAISMTI